MKLLTLALLAAALTAAIPFPTPPQRIPLHADTTQGPITILAGDAYCYVQLDGAASWIGPMPLTALDPYGGIEGATAGTTFCAGLLVTLPNVVGTMYLTKKVEVSATLPTLSGAVAAAKAALADAMSGGWFPVPCE